MMATFGRGTYIEVCPYQPNRAFHYLAQLDGCRGVVQKIQGHGQKCNAKVDLESKWHSGPVDIPVAALKAVADG